MSLFCFGDSKATVYYKDESGNDAVFSTNNTPINVDCDNQVRTGKFIYTVAFTGYFFGTCNPGNGNFGGEFIADSYTETPALPFTNYGTCFANKYEFFIDGNKTDEIKVTSDRTITSRLNPNYSKGGNHLIIKNAQGIEIFKRKVQSCDYRIACGNECPPNHIKCKCNSYPGYCCIPCSEVVGGIKSITAAVRGVNRG